MLRVWSFTTFQFAEYVRSGRIVIELVATVPFLAPSAPVPGASRAILFARRRPDSADDAVHVHGAARPRPVAAGYVLLTRPLGRSGYLLGLYLVTVIPWSA